jgi:hypothetical protein
VDNDSDFDYVRFHLPCQIKTAGSDANAPQRRGGHECNQRIIAQKTVLPSRRPRCHALMWQSLWLARKL